MLCQAYDLYARGLAGANQVLSEVRKSPEFVKFIKVCQVLCLILIRLSNTIKVFYLNTYYDNFSFIYEITQLKYSDFRILILRFGPLINFTS